MRKFVRTEKEKKIRSKLARIKRKKKEKKIAIKKTNKERKEMRL